MSTELLIAIIGVISTIAGSWLSNFFTKRKYNTEVESNELKNLKETFNVYKTIADDNRLTIEELIKDRLEKSDKIDKLCDENKALNDKIDELMKLTKELSEKICLNFECTKRVVDATKIKTKKK